jgi:hypothetical protein
VSEESVNDDEEERDGVSMKVPSREARCHFERALLHWIVFYADLALTSS